MGAHEPGDQRSHDAIRVYLKPMSRAGSSGEEAGFSLLTRKAMEWGFSPGYPARVSLAPQHLRTFMVTFVTNGRRRLLQTEANASLMCETLQAYRAQGKYNLHAFVVMPDHIHVLLTPASEVSLEKTVQLIKGGFSFRLRSKCEVWERGRFDRRIADTLSYDSCVTYIHQNPVRARMVQSAEQFTFSSAYRIADVNRRPAWFSYADQG